MIRRFVSLTFLASRVRLPQLQALLFALFGASVAHADQDSEIASIRTLLGSTQPGMVIDAVVPSPVAGLYEVQIQNGQALYVSADAKYLIPGDLFEARTEGLVNLGEARRNDLRQQKIAALDEKDMIIYPASAEEKAVLTVFTDVDCPYCRKLHGEMAELNGMGVTVRYLAFPRTGLDTETSAKMISTWCAEDREAMFTAAKRGTDVPPVDCDSPVEEQYQLGREVGVTGTPALVFDDGSIVPGYIPAATLAQYLFTE
jgi:thiol:disulfide interchange protein DsbC